MTESTPSNTPVLETEASQDAPAMPGKQSEPRGAFAQLLTLNVLLLAAVGLLGFLLWQQGRTMEALSGDAYSQQQRSNAIEQLLAEAERERERLDAALQQAMEAGSDDATQAELQALQQEVQLLRGSVAAQARSGGQGWQLTEIAGLLRLAQQRAQLAGDIPAAISLYQNANAQLQQQQDATMQPVRAALLLELDALRAVEVPQIDTLYLQLGEVARQLDALQVQSEAGGTLQFEAPASSAAQQAAGWWDSLLQLLSRYFVVTRQDAPVLARLSPEQVFLVRQAIRLQIESARLALLQREPRLYQDALDAAQAAISAQLQGESKASLLASLQRLRDEPITAEIPSLGAALQALELLQVQVSSQAAGAPTP
jgi:uroporphyrin-3 C-methyltransferase